MHHVFALPLFWGVGGGGGLLGETEPHKHQFPSTWWFGLVVWLLRFPTYPPKPGVQIQFQTTNPIHKFRITSAKKGENTEQTTEQTTPALAGVGVGVVLLSKTEPHPNKWRKRKTNNHQTANPNRQFRITSLPPQKKRTEKKNQKPAPGLEVSSAHLSLSSSRWLRHLLGLFAPPGLYKSTRPAQRFSDLRFLVAFLTADCLLQLVVVFVFVGGGEGWGAGLGVWGRSWAPSN